MMPYSGRNGLVWLGLLLFIMFAGCNYSDDSNSLWTTYPDASFQYPLAVGMHWNYQFYHTDSLFDSTQTFIRKDTVEWGNVHVSVESLDLIHGAAAYRIMTIEDVLTEGGFQSWQYTSFSWLQNRADGLYQIAYHSYSSFHYLPKRLSPTRHPLGLFHDIYSPNSVSELDTTFVDPPRLCIPYPISVGANWSYTFPSMMTRNSTILENRLYTTSSGPRACFVIQDRYFYNHENDPEVLVTTGIGNGGVVFRDEYDSGLYTDETGAERYISYQRHFELGSMNTSVRPFPQEISSYADTHFIMSDYLNAEFTLAQLPNLPSRQSSTPFTGTRAQWDALPWFWRESGHSKSEYLPWNFTHEPDSTLSLTHYTMIGNYPTQFGFGWDDQTADNPTTIGAWDGQSEHLDYYRSLLLRYGILHN